MSAEDFDLASLAAFLHVTPEQVRRMAERGRIPARRVGGNWKFSRAEIHNWFEERIGASDNRELAEVEKILERHRLHQDNEAISLADLLSVDRVFVPFLAKTRNSVIDSICELTSRGGVLWEPTKMAEAVRTREDLHPTALESGVALLHPRRPLPGIIGEPFLSLAVCSSGIPFGGPRGCLTDIFFLLGSTSEAFHLRLLARLSRLLQVPDFLNRLRNAEIPRDIFSIVEECEGVID
jgi:PTS system nitrogen regulatory IIA component